MIFCLACLLHTSPKKEKEAKHMVFLLGAKPALAETPLSAVALKAAIVWPFKFRVFSLTTHK